MAKRVIHLLVDDIDGGEADETVKFSIDGLNYEIDLSTKNAAKLRDAFAPFVAAGVKVGRAPSMSLTEVRALASVGRVSRTTSRRPPTPASDKEERDRIRTWLREQGYHVATQGAIKETYVQMYYAAHNGGGAKGVPAVTFTPARGSARKVNA